VRVGIFSQGFRSTHLPKYRPQAPARSWGKPAVYKSAQPAPQVVLQSSPLRIMRSQFDHHAYALRTNFALGAMVILGAASHAALGFGTLGASLLWTPTAAAAAWYKVIKPRWQGFVSFRAMLKNFSADRRSIIREILELYETFAVELSYARAILQEGNQSGKLPEVTRLGDFGYRRSHHPVDKAFYEGSVRDYLTLWVGRLEAAMADFETTMQPGLPAKQLSEFWQQKSKILDDFCSGLLDLEG